MLLQHTKETIDLLPKVSAEDNSRKTENITTQTSTFEDLLVKVAYANPDLILLAMEIRKRL